MGRKITESDYDSEKFYRHAKFTTIDECIMWIGGVSKDGYGVYYYKGRKYAAHRISYFINVGEIDESMVIDHICMNRLCIHPEHLRQVTQSINAKENTRSKTEMCTKGHVYDEENTRYMKDGIYMHKKCVECLKEKSKNDYQKKKRKQIRQNKGT